MERIWGGRKLAELFHKALPADVPIGESWEIVDRAEAQSVVREGPLAGHNLHELWEFQRESVFGAGLPDAERFPLLFKLLDARETLSLQVHPTAEVAAAYGGEPKTEMWYVAQAEPRSEIFAGLKRGTTRDAFERGVREGHAADYPHCFPSRTGAAVFIPGGRLHAIGAGNVIVEVMQNSDTTYRVFDWNRVGLDGRPRQLHLEQSLRSIRFDDFEPTLATPVGEVQAECPFFRVERLLVSAPRPALAGDRFAIFTVLAGNVDCGGRIFRAGDFFLVPAALKTAVLRSTQDQADVLRTTIPL